jgi:hypothetical protein
MNGQFGGRYTRVRHHAGHSVSKEGGLELPFIKNILPDLPEISSLPPRTETFCVCIGLFKRCMELFEIEAISSLFDLLGLLNDVSQFTKHLPLRRPRRSKRLEIASISKSSMHLLKRPMQTQNVGRIDPRSLLPFAIISVAWTKYSELQAQNFFRVALTLCSVPASRCPHFNH